MPKFCKVFLIFAAFALTGAGVAQAQVPKPKPREATAIERAFDAADRNAWNEAQTLAEQAGSPLTAKIIEWLRYQNPDPELDFVSVARFVEKNPSWPRLSRLRRAAEAAIGRETDDAAVIAWFDRYPPLSGAGAIAHLDALTNSGQLAAARALVPQYWRDIDFTSDQDKEFNRKYSRQLANADHLERLDRLIWDHRYWPARRMLQRVDAPDAALGRARLALMRREGGVDAAIARVPNALRDHPDLQYERLRWRRRKGMDQSARELLFDAPPEVTNPDRWATERLILARRALSDGHYSEALRMVAAHNLSEGAKFAEAEFLAGWISLTFLDEPDAAYQRFTNLYEGVGYPISRARGAYWAGRAAAAKGDSKAAARWWRVAAAFPATFYGQQAAFALGDNDLAIPFTVPTSPVRRAHDVDAELAGAVRLLHENGQTQLIGPFLRQLSYLSSDLDQRFAVVELANQVEQPHEAIRVAKRIAQLDNVVPRPGYPLLPPNSSAKQTVRQQREAPLVLALIRQESAFNARAVSRAGARGMMQLMPATAQRVARATGQRYSRELLLDDPAYNISLGTAYLETMFDRFDQTSALALAAYNAGPNRVDRWLRQFGDPRTGEIDLIDWIESIPFSETRNYVQRVLESELVYRELLMNEQVARNPEQPTDEGAQGN